MGHIRIGALPATRPWKEVVGLVTEDANVAKVAEATAHASELAFTKVQNDAGFREAVWLLTQLGVAASKPDGTAHLKAVGVDLSGAGSVVEIAMALGSELDWRIDATRQRSDFGEMAQRALISSVTEYLQDRMPTLMPAQADDVSAALGRLDRKKEFGQLARNFFGKLTEECIEYFVSKTLATHVGEEGRFTTTAQLAEFESALGLHCREASLIVEEFSGDWFSKNRFEGGGDIAREKAEAFGWYALEKMRKEVAARARNDER